MQTLPEIPGVVACSLSPREVLPQTTPQKRAVALSAPPTWNELPASRRRRLVAVLGVLVQRNRKEAIDDPRE
jgi:hypothetical protein